MTVPMHTDDRGWALYRADYRDTLDIVAQAGGADLITFSPPYCDARTYGMAVSWGDADYAALGDAVWSALKPGGHALVNVDAPVRDWTKDGRGTERGMHPWRMLLDWHDRIGFRVPDRLAFGRQGQPGHFWGFRNDWEPLLWFQRPGAPGHEPDAAAIGAPAVTAGRVMQYGRRRPDGERVLQRIKEREPIKRRGNLWSYGDVGNHTGAPDIEAQDHPARWPYKLARDLVLCFSAPGALVVDPFVGAGTTAAAAVDHGRRFIGGDLGARMTDGVPWVTVAHKVLIDRNRQGTLF
jgi:hypothetical protein